MAGFNIGKISSIVNGISTAASVYDIVNKIDVSSLNPSSLGSIKGTIQSALNGDMSAISGQLQSAISTNDITSMADQFNIEGKTNELTSQIQAGTIDQSQIDKMMEEIKSSADFSAISYM